MKFTLLICEICEHLEDSVEQGQSIIRQTYPVAVYTNDPWLSMASTS